MQVPIPIVRDQLDSALDALLRSRRAALLEAVVDPNEKPALPLELA
jgi:hypothetical protein